MLSMFNQTKLTSDDLSRRYWLARLHPARCTYNLLLTGSKFDQHVLCPARSLLNAGAGRPTALQRHGGNEPADDGRPEPDERQQKKEEGVGSAKSQEDV